MESVATMSGWGDDRPKPYTLNPTHRGDTYDQNTCERTH